MIQDKAVTAEQNPFHFKWNKKPLLQFAADLLDHLTAGLPPIEVLRREEDKEDLSWLINSKGDGWVVSERIIFSGPLCNGIAGAERLADESNRGLARANSGRQFFGPSTRYGQRGRL
jgi:hypothetical protein